MKNALFISFLIIFGCYPLAQAQETLLPLRYNPILQDQVEAAEKGFQRNFRDFCGDLQQHSFVQSTIKPTVFQANGSITIQMQGLSSPYTVQYSSLNNNTVTAQYDTPTFSITDLHSGVYAFVLSDQNNTQTLMVDLDDIGSLPNVPTMWNVEQQACLPAVLRATTALPAAQSTIKIYNAQHQLVGSLSNNTLATIGDYYVEREASASGAKSYYVFYASPQPSITALPFRDDFSTTTIYPDFHYWADNYAYINDDFATNPLSLGVATLDGFNEHGLPYQVPASGSEVIDGMADFLTTQPVCFEKIDSQDLSTSIDTLYLSFFYQAQGLGDYANDFDTIFVEVLGISRNWHQLWFANGPDAPVPNPRFAPAQLLIPKFWYNEDLIVTDTLLWEGMQIRWRNNASTSGSNDHWHLDYVMLDTEPLTLDATGLFPVISNEEAIAALPGTLLKNYQAMPWSHFYDYMDTQLADTIALTMREYESDFGETTIHYALSDVCLPPAFYEMNSAGSGASGFDQTNTEEGIFIQENIKNALLEQASNFENRNQIVLETEWTLENNIDDLLGNNTAYQYQKFLNYFAHDDGTAEKAYALYSTNGKVAQRFILSHPDTLRALQIHFIQQNENIGELEFKIAVWKNLVAGEANEELLYESDYLLPQHLGDPNGFWTYPLSEALLVEGEIFVGFIQKNNNFLPIGFDRNHDASKQIFYNATGSWDNTIYQGALMIRPIVGAALSEINVGIGEPQTPSANASPTSLLAYPNPSNGLLHIRFEQTSADIQVFDYTGKMVIEQANFVSNNTLDLSHLPLGIYLVQASTPGGSFLANSKVVLIK